MTTTFAAELHSASTLGELPGYRDALELTERGKAAGDAFARDARLPGILLSEGGRFRTAVSRRYYLDAIGRYCGMDLYHPRPLHFLMARYDELGGPLVLHASTPIAEAVERGLGRARERLYEPLVVADEARPQLPLASVRLVDFEHLLVAASRLTSLRAAAMRQILGSVREGLLLLDRELRVGPEYADSVEPLLGLRELAGRRFRDVLADCLDAERAEIGDDFAETLFEPRIIETLVESINPLRRATTRGGRVLSFAFTRRRGLDGIEGLLVRIEDVTREELLRHELEIERRRSDEQAQLALAVVQADPALLAAFLARARGVLTQLRGGATGDASGLRRALHGAKGEAGLLGLPHLASEIHDVESALAPPRTEQSAGGELRAAAARLEASIARLGELFSRVLDSAGRARGLGTEAEHPARVGPGRRAAPGKGTDPTPDPAAHPMDGLFSATERFAQQLAAEFGKPLRWVQRVDRSLLAERHRDVLALALPQLVRNALVHGVEGPDERARRGKPATATVQLAVRRHASGAVEIVFQDDGRGLDEARLIARAQQLGIPAPPAHALHALVFAPGLSTVESPGPHAGRGIGLDAVRAAALAAGGRVDVHSQSGRYCAFRLLLPAAPEPVAPAEYGAVAIAAAEFERA